MTAARNATVKADEIENYKQAINLNPERSEAYLEILEDAFLDDNVLTSGESEQLRQIMISYGGDGSQTNEIAFKHNEEGYDQFAYEMGIAYYYKFQEKSNKKNAKSYFEIAQASEHLKSSQVERARRLYMISDYYSKIGIVDDTGDAPVTYLDFWNDMTALSEGNLVAMDNEKTALIMYQELATQIISHTADFKNDGVTKADMETQLLNIEAHLKTDFINVSAGNRDSINAEIEKLETYIDQARRMIQSAFGQTN